MPIKIQLFAYLGINEQGNLALYVSTGRLNPVGTRLEKGTPLPESVLKTYEINYLHDTPEDAVSALQALTKYLDNQAKDKKRK